ncbi:MAG: M14 family metallopeptidase [Gemmatimonadota bacterium]
MQMQNSLRFLPACLLAVFLMTAGFEPAIAQSKLQENPGGYHGELDFTMSWKRYYSYEEWTKIMHDIQDQYSQLADIESIGKSRMGRDQFLITITAKSTGTHDTKPAMWVDGAIHGNEVNGIMCSLYLMWYLLTRYDYDPFVYDLVNSNTFYILPGLNVDANDSFVSFPNNPSNPREPYRPEDNDGDGLYDEDQTEDVDGDGQMSTMYIEDSEGPFKLSADGRQFIAVTDDSEQVRRFIRIGSEGFDNDGDGRINEDDIGGPDPNRNYPFAWTLQAGWPYTMSEPETRNAYEFMRTHDNIFAAFHYHNTGRLIMSSGPGAVQAAAQGQAAQGGGGRGGQPADPAARLAQMREENKYAQLFDRTVAPEYQHDFDVQTEIVTMGARILKNYDPSISSWSGQGQAQVNDYGMLGAYGYLIELWGSPDFAADINDDGRVSPDETMMWIDTELHGEGWVTPHSFNHPDLGEIWIGGTQKKHTQRTPPARYIEMEAQKNADFVMYCASQFPKVEIDKIKVTPEAGNLYWVDVTVKNDKVYPTFSDRENELGTAVQDKLMFRSAGNVSLIAIPDGMTQIDPVNTSSRANAVGEATYEFKLRGKDSQTFRYLVEKSGGSGWVEFTVESFHGGTATQRAEIR